MHEGELQLYGRMGDDGYDGIRVGARITADTRCTRCGGRFLQGHALTADLAPNMAGTARHTDCDDPTLEHSLEGVTSEPLYCCALYGGHICYQPLEHAGPHTCDGPCGGGPCSASWEDADAE